MKKLNKIAAFRRLTTLTLLAGASTHLHASSEFALEEIIVTAQKREQSVQEIPISVTAFDAAAIRELGINNLSDIGDYVPNTFISKGIAPSNATVSIRGIAGSIDFLSTSEPGVGLYLNGVIISKNNGSLFDLVALERIEVLKGPQGTLFGKNTIGGAINLVTQKPTGEFGGEVTIGGGSNDLLHGKVSLNLPSIGEIGEGLGRLNTLIALSTRKTDGTIKNPLAGSTYSEVEALGGLVNLQWDISDQLGVEYIYDYSDSDDTSPNRQLLEAVPFSLGYTLLGQDNRERESSWSTDGFDTGNTKVEGHALTVSYQINDSLALKSITSMRDMETSGWGDIDGTSNPIFTSRTDLGSIESTTQEFQLIGSGERFNYVAGVYYFEEEGEDVFEQTIFVPRGIQTVQTDNEALAAFGQVSWDITDTLTLTGGLRYTEETREMYTSSVPEANDLKEDYDNWSPMAAISWAPSEDINLYAKVSQGWRSGGFNGRASSLPLLAPVDEETITSYEVGLKSYFMDRRVRMNSAIFYNDYQDKQVAASVVQPDGTIAVVTSNAGEASLQGLEIEVLALLTQNLELSASYGYLDTEYDEWLSGGINIADQRAFAYAPENTVALGVKYTIDSFSWGTASARLDYAWKDDFHTQVQEWSWMVTDQESYEQLHGRIDISNIKIGEGNLGVAIWGKNLTDEDFLYSTIDLRTSLGWTIGRWNEARRYGIDLTYDF